MARIRSLHPTQWTDEEFVPCSAFARLLCLGLRNEADDQGIFEWKPLTLKMRLLPADNVEVEDLLAELEENNQVRKFEANGKTYGAIRNFRKYQRPKKPNAVYPITEEIREYVGIKPAKEGTEQALTESESETGDEQVTDESPTSSSPVEESGEQMEDVGGRRLEVGNNPPLPPFDNPPEKPPERIAFERYNALAEDLGRPVAQVFGPDRQAKMRARLKECGGLDGWDIALEKIRGSPYLRGEENSYTLTLDSVLRKKLFTKLMEGGYPSDGDLAKRKTGSATGHDRDAQRRATIDAAMGRA